MKKMLPFLLGCWAWMTYGQPDGPTLLARADSSLGPLQTLSYQIDYAQKYLTSSDTLQRRAICVLQAAPDDTLRLYHQVTDLTQNWQQAYNGAQIINTRFSDSSLLIVDTQANGYSFVTGNTIQYFIRCSYFRPRPFSRYLDRKDLAHYTVLPYAPPYSPLVWPAQCLHGPDVQLCAATRYPRGG